MPDAAPAVFLSYASQDAEPVRRLCEALRAAGVEVWFDQNELTGGDAWDQKIRGQIKACALFVPVISAGTQARREGYFRIEWKLAAQRTHAIADGTPFLLPVVIDGTRDGEALVPEEFRAVQWTRLPGGEATAAFCAQVKRLLAGASAVPARDETLFKKQRPGSRGIFAALGVLALGAVVFIALRSRAQLPPAAAAVEPVATKNNEAPAAFSPARQMAEKARAMSLEYYDSTADDYAAAEGLIKRALELDQNDAEIWTISSLFNTGIRTRGFDHSPARPNAALRDASRALKLAPDSITARFALGRAQLDTDRTGATETFKQILARDPNNVGAMGSMAWIYDQEGRIDESAALYERLVQQDPSRLALTRYTEFLLYFHYGRFAEADRAVRQSIAVKPSANSVAGLSILTLTWKGDTEEAIRIFEQAPSSMRNEPRTVWMTVLVQLCRRKPDEALKVLDRLSADYVQDS